MADGVDTITDWSVVPGYGSEMMAPDDKVVFWVSGDSRIMTRGIWGIGHVADYAQDRSRMTFRWATSTTGKTRRRDRLGRQPLLVSWAASHLELRNGGE